MAAGEEEAYEPDPPPLRRRVLDPVPRTQEGIRRTRSASRGAVAATAERPTSTAGGARRTHDGRPGRRPAPPRDHGVGRSRDRASGWWSTLVAWCAAVWNAVVGLVLSMRFVRRGRAPGSYDVVVRVLHRVMQAQPASAEAGSHPSDPGAADAGDEAVFDRMRAHRAPRTEASIASTCRSIEQLVRCNPERVARVARLDDAWDRIAEAWVAARVDPDGSPWQVPEAWRKRRYEASAAEKAIASWRAAMVRLRYAPDSWPRSRSMAQSLGGGDTEGARHADPLFAWEVLTGIRARPPVSTWDRCAAALLVMSMLNAARRGNARRITIGGVQVVSADTVSLTLAERPKPARDRAVVREGKHNRPVRIRHWAVGRFVIPWVNFLRERGFHHTAMLFPSLVREGPRIVRTAVGRTIDGLWCEPLRPWSDRALIACIQRFVPDRNGRTFQSMRAGNNVELRRAAGVSDVTRRTLHGRSVRELIGSETAYNEVFAEDFGAATVRLGSLRIVRQPDGLLACSATSESACERDDWVEVKGAAPFSAPPAEPASESSDDDSDDARVHFSCFRCGADVPKAHHGYLCDREGCVQGTCVTCHPGGEGAPLLCPAHR